VASRTGFAAGAGDTNGEAKDDPAWVRCGVDVAAGGVEHPTSVDSGSCAVGAGSKTNPEGVVADNDAVVTLAATGVTASMEAWSKSPETEKGGEAQETQMRQSTRSYNLSWEAYKTKHESTMKGPWRTALPELLPVSLASTQNASPADHALAIVHWC
jgi:hypothetical protein